MDDPILSTNLKGGRTSFVALHVMGQLRGGPEFLSLDSEHLSRPRLAKER